MPKPVVLVILEDNELKTTVLGGEPTVIVVDLDALLGDGSAQEKLDELQSLPAGTVEQWKLARGQGQAPRHHRRRRGGLRRRGRRHRGLR